MQTQDYESSIRRLEEIVQLLEDGKLPLEESLKLFEEGIRLSGRCGEYLSAAELKITELSELEKERDDFDELV